jgi:hypothetical protein
MKIHAVSAIGLLLTLSCVAQASDGEPQFAGVWSAKEPGGTGAFFIDQTWEGLVSHWKELGADQYLADVEAYRENGQWRFAGLWRIGPGNGALYLLDWNRFVDKWTQLKESQDLIDIEIFRADNALKYLGVWRRKQGRERGNCAFFTGLTWEALVAKWKELGDGQRLIKVEPYLNNGKRLFAGVWQIGSGNGALYLMNDWQKFSSMKESLDLTQEIIDFEMFQTNEGQWNFLGVWRRAARKSGPLHASLNAGRFRPLSADQLLDHWARLKQNYTLVNIAVVVSEIILRGDTTCKYGDVDCNRCATDVVTQFRLAFETGHRPWISWDAGSWSFSGSSRYPPDNSKPEDAFDRFAEGLASKHIQGFVRTNSSRYPYAGSHSHKDRGSIFFINVDKNGKNTLFALQRANNDHPSGVSVLGDGLYVAEGDRLRWFGISAAIDNQDNGYEIPKDLDPRHKGLQGAGGGLGLAKLQDGSYLLMVTARGDGFRLGTTVEGIEQNLEPRYTRFYRIVGNDAGHPSKPIQFLGEFTHREVSKYPKTPMSYSENLSLVIECGSGHLYAIHTTGQYLLNGDGYWRLSRVEIGPEGPSLKHIGMARQDQRQDDCHHRSSATVHVNEKGELEFLCTERTVTKMNPTGTFNFLEGKK